MSEKTKAAAKKIEVKAPGDAFEAVMLRLDKIDAQITAMKKEQKAIEDWVGEADRFLDKTDVFMDMVKEELQGSSRSFNQRLARTK